MSVVEPAAGDVFENRFFALGGEAGEVGFGLAVKEPDGEFGIDDDDGFLHAVEHELVEAAHAVVVAFVFFGRGVGGFEEGCAV